MKFNEQWLREWVNPAVTTDELTVQLTMSGLEVDAVEPVVPAFSGVVVGEVLSIKPHPEADRLQICQVNVGSDEPLSIVCGASNVRIGMFVPTACIGAVLPSDFKIKKSKLRGEFSFGMLCSAKELGMAESAEGLLPLPTNSTPGQDVRECLLLDDVSIELGLTPNRSDCLSLSGVAREVGVLNRCAVEAPSDTMVKPSIDDELTIAVSAQKACPRYLGRIVCGVNVAAETPLWMQERLRRCGLRSISPVVDVTNYVMLELGQPMHAFDLSLLEGNIDVRYASAQEHIELLDGQNIKLDDETLVIADQQGAVALAGIMGGQRSSVSDATNDLFLESAFFSPSSITGKARDYGLHTDSSHRFERGVDYDLPRVAMERATNLLMDIVGGQAGPINEVVAEQFLPVHEAITLRASRLKRVLGVVVNDDDVSEILKRLGLDVIEIINSKEDGTSWRVVSPSFRFDIEIEVDLIEEVARIYGYDQLPDSGSSAAMHIDSSHAADKPVSRIRQLLADRAYNEVITYSFIDQKTQKILDPEQQGIELKNPISADLSVMRTSLWPGLIKTLQYNLNRQQKRVKIFECGVKYIKQHAEINEENIISGVAYGGVYPEQWDVDGHNVDFYDIKGDVEAILKSSKQFQNYNFVSAQHPVLHPGQSAKLVDAKGDCLGWVGQLHPAVASELSLDGNVYVFELKSSPLAIHDVSSFHPLSRFPAMRRDLAIIVDEQVTAQQVIDCVIAAGGDLLQDTQLFDVYTGKGVDSGRKSLAIGLTIQDFSRTLVDDEIDAVVKAVISHLEEKLGATLRE